MIFSGGLDRGQHPCPVKGSVECLVRWLVEKDLLLAAHLAKGLDKSTFIFLTGDDLKSRTNKFDGNFKKAEAEASKVFGEIWHTLKAMQPLPGVCCT